MNLGTALYTYFCGKLVGTDTQGNKYYTSKRACSGQKAKRWVAYKDKVEPSLVPAEWHGWLHYRTNTPPTEKTPVAYSWQKAHTPNFTGSSQAYFPSGHHLKGGKTPKASGDYQPWQP
jgi:NADH:ubiquinone oxidoreductase subunit